MSEETPASFTIYFDTNVVSYVDAGSVPDFLSILAENGHKLVVSDTVLEELPGGSGTKVLSSHNFLYVLSHDAAHINGIVNFYRSVDPADNAVNVDALELFLRSLLRSTAGSTSVPDLNFLFRNAIDDIAEELMSDLPEGTDPRIVAQLDLARKHFSQGLELIPPIPSPIISKEEMAAHQMTPKQLNNIRPPSVIRKIIELYPVATEWLEKLLAPFTQDEDIKSRIQELCLALILLGFARDKGIGKDDQRKSDDGARAQFQDIGQICAASTCDIFITSDRRCARLAFAVFESLGLGTAVFHLLPGQPNELKLGLVGPNHWP